jgi:6-phosphogluconolactonase
VEAPPGKEPPLSPHIRRSTLVVLATLLFLASTAGAARDLYTADSADNRIYGAALSGDGAMAALPGFPVLSGQGPSALVPARNGTRLYATFSAANAVGIYTINDDGFIHSSTPAVQAGASPSAAAISPDGTRLFVTNAGAASVSRYVVDLTGGLSSLGAATPTGTAPAAVAMTPDGTHLYVANKADDTISMYSVSPAGGLTELGPATAGGDGPASLTITSDGAYIYAANANAGTVSGWSIGPDGLLSSVGDATTAGGGAAAIAASPDGSRVLVANPGDSTISRFRVGSGGILGSAGTATAGPPGAASIAISPDGKHAYAGGSSAIASFDLSDAADLSARADTPITTLGADVAIAITPNQGPQAKFDRVAGPTGQDSTFSADSSSDPDGTVAQWHWDFGDGTTGEGMQVTHAYTQPGTYNTTLSVVDNEGCSTSSVYVGQASACVGTPPSVRTITITDAPPGGTPDQPCQHDGDDGFCGTPDRKAPSVQILGFNDKASISTVDAPEELVGMVTPDPSGIKEIRLRFTEAGGTITKRTVKTKRVCRKVKGKRKCTRKPVYKQTCKKVKGKRRCTRKKVVKVTKTPACLTISGTKNYLVKYQCAKVPWIPVPGDTTFRFALPVALGTGSYTVEVLASDGAGNTDVLEPGRNDMSFQIVNTPSNSGGDGTGVGTDTGGGTTTTPIDDTGSPFGKG